MPDNTPLIPTEPDWDGTPLSRTEEILYSIIHSEEWDGTPLSRGEYLLLQVKDAIENNSMLDIKGRVDSVEDLPATGNKKGDVYSVGTEDQLNRPEYYWDGTEWDYLGQLVDLSGYATLQDLSSAVNSAASQIMNTVGQQYLKLNGGVMTGPVGFLDGDARISGVNDKLEISSSNGINMYAPGAAVNIEDGVVTIEQTSMPTSDSTDTAATTKWVHSLTDESIKKKPVIYGYRLNQTTKEVTYIADSRGMTPASMGTTTFDYGSWEDAFFMPKPCMLKYDGTVDYYLDPNDYTKKLDGTASDVGDSTYGGNVMVEFPMIYYKCVVNGDYVSFYCSNYKVDDTYDCWANYDCDNNTIPNFYMRAYAGVILNNTMRSLSGYALTDANGVGNTTGQSEISAARANNQNGVDEWYTAMIVDHFLIAHLLTLIGKGVNHQAIFGRGLDTGAQAAKEAYVTGTLNDKGLFWGVTTNGNSGMKVFGIENFYACSWTRCAGLIGTSTGYKYKLTHGTHDGSTATAMNTDGTGWIDLEVDRPSAHSWLIDLTYLSNGCWFPKTTGAQADSKYNDYSYIGNEYVFLGGASSSGTYWGSWCVNMAKDVGYANWSISSALSCKPRA